MRSHTQTFPLHITVIDYVRTCPPHFNLLDSTRLVISAFKHSAKEITHGTNTHMMLSLEKKSQKNSRSIFLECIVLMIFTVIISYDDTDKRSNHDRERILVRDKCLLVGKTGDTRSEPEGDTGG